jgi:hypothetical protein
VRGFVVWWGAAGLCLCVAHAVVWSPVQVNGRLACLGTSQHLKGKFGQGYLMEIKTRNIAKEADLHEFVMSLCPGAVLDESHSGQFKYSLPHGLQLSRLFRAVEQRKGDLEVEDYSISQTTLEQVFLSFARQQVATASS